MTGWLAYAGWLWLTAAALLAGLELAIPGVFLVFVAIGAAVTGLISLLLPGFPFELQWVALAVSTGLSVLIGKRWYRDFPVETSDPALNDRIARLIGQEVTVSEAIRHGCGRVRVGDGDWPARGPDTDVSTRVRIVGGQSSVLEVVPVDVATT